MRLKSTILDSILKDAANNKPVDASNKQAGFERHLHNAMEKLGYNSYAYNIDQSSSPSRLTLKGKVMQAQYEELAKQLVPDFNAKYNEAGYLEFFPVKTLFGPQKFAKKKTAEAPTLDKIMATLKKGLPSLVTTLNMSATQANQIFEIAGEKNAEKAYKKLIFAADLIQESLTLIGKIKL